jgi:molybdopterin synthase sulfur carrier subunit
VAEVFIPALLRKLSGNRSSVKVPGTTVREIVANLEHECPGIADRLLEGDRLRSNIQVAVDGAVSPIGLREPVGPESEVHFVAAISGGQSPPHGRIPPN